MSDPVIHREFAQHSPEWYAIKAGKFSASKAAIIMGGLDTSGLASLIKDLAWERVYGVIDEPQFHSKAMQRGTETECEARDWYAFDRDVVIEEIGFVEHASIPNVGWSPDGIFENRAIEAKCPLHKAWMETKRTGKVPAEYRWQCRWAQWVGQLEGVEFIAYSPQAGGLVVPFEATESEFEQMAERISLLEPKVQEWVEILTDKRNAA